LIDKLALYQSRTSQLAACELSVSAIIPWTLKSSPTFSLLIISEFLAIQEDLFLRIMSILDETGVQLAFLAQLGAMRRTYRWIPSNAKPRRSRFESGVWRRDIQVGVSSLSNPAALSSAHSALGSSFPRMALFALTSEILCPPGITETTAG